MSFKYIDGIELPIEICSYGNSKSVKIYVKNGYLKITKPKWYSGKNVIQYVEKNKQQINELCKVSKEKQAESRLLSKKQLLYLGKKYDLHIEQYDNNQKAQLYVKEDCIHVSIPKNISDIEKESALKGCVNNLYKKATDIYVARFLDKYCNDMLIKVPKFRIKNCKTRWGSCSEKGNLNFNIKLGMLPIPVIEQVVVHEICHLRHLNHSNDFWNLVYTHYDKEKYMQGEQWIKEHCKNICW